MDKENTTLEQDVTMLEEDPDLEPGDAEYDFEEDDEEKDLWDDEEPEGEDTEPEQEETFTVKYNGEERTLTREELITAAQKGLNYDKIKGKLDSAESGVVYKAMKAGADKAGMSVEDYANYLLENSEADKQLEAEREIREKYPGAPAAMVKELAKYRANAEESAAKTKEKTDVETAEQKAWAEALQEYPDLKLDQIPEDVLKNVKEGMSPLRAMMKHEILELRKQTQHQEIEKKNEANRKATIGSLKGRGGPDAKDPFLEGYGM